MYHGFARSAGFDYWRSLGWFSGGLAFDAAYGVVQLLVARSGGNLDAWFVQPLTGGASKINIYGAIEGASVYRPNALTGDPNHLGIAAFGCGRQAALWKPHLIGFPYSDPRSIGVSVPMIPGPHPPAPRPDPRSAERV